MGFPGVAVLLDFVSSLAVLGLLVVGFSALGPKLKHSRYGALVLGALFGLVVNLQMSMPLSPVEGVIVDMRNVPIVLAGAFLGLRGLVMCLGLAIASRLGIGGVGVSAGIGGMLIAGAVGYAWAHIAQRVHANDWVKLGTLGVAVNAHMVSAVLAPADIMMWYYLEVAPTVMLLNILCVPAIGAMLMREQNLTRTHARLAASAKVDPVTRLLHLDAFAREVSHFNVSETDTQIAGIVAITLKDAKWLAQTWGDTAIDQSLGALRVRLAQFCADNRPLGVDGQGRILVPVTDAEMHNLTPFRKTMRRLATDAPVLLDGKIEVPFSVVVEHFSLRQPHKPGVIISDVHRSVTPRRAAPNRTAVKGRTGDRSGDAPLPGDLSNKTVGRLFDQADTKLRNLA